MKSVTVRELRNKGGEVLDPVERGERVVVTRDGRPIAELRPLPRRSARPEELIERSHLAVRPVPYPDQSRS